jgi:hypothetical protein
MKNKLFAAALAAVTLAGAALPAAAQEFRDHRGGYTQDFRGDWRFRNQITIRDHGRQVSVDRNDRLFYRLLDSPFRFRPGLTYTYTDRCDRGQCMVLVSSLRGQPLDRLWAPRLGRLLFQAGYDERGPRDGDHWDDRGRDGRGYDGGPYRGDDRGPRTLEGGPR